MGNQCKPGSIRAVLAGMGKDCLPEIPVGDEQDPEEYFNRVVIVVRGGVVVSVITNTDEPLEYALVDFDNLEGGGKAWEHGWEPAEPWNDMDDAVALALNPETFTCDQCGNDRPVEKQFAGEGICSNCTLDNEQEEPHFTCKVCEQEKPLSLQAQGSDDTCEECGGEQLRQEDEGAE